MNSERIFDVRGAIYVTSRAWNAYQMWRDYSEDEIERDMGFAESINLNALRLWLSYEYWLEHSVAAFARFDHLLETASRRGIRIVPSLFEGNGPDPARERLNDTHFETAVCLASPSSEIILERALWDGPLAFVEAFMKRYADDERILAIELINEPENMGKLEKESNPQRYALLRTTCMKFAREAVIVANTARGEIPITVGTGPIALNGAYMDLDIDIWQFHHNFPRSTEDFESSLADAKMLQEVMGRPVWISEWQRVRSATGWTGEKIPTELLKPKLSTLAALVDAAGIGSFFWSLMIKPAYLSGQRKAGTVNGLFHEDGTVFRLEDARAVSGDPNLEFDERPQWPDWIRETAARYVEV